ncbi:hypothetical protein M758_11G109400 [Ceratodon purpureus]|nr:hypothetical protein M758_11G109400 [Ceratodon purpureus]
MELQEQPMDTSAGSTEQAAHQNPGVILQTSQLSPFELGKSASVERHLSELSSPYFSPRIQSMRHHASEFSSRLDFQIAASKSHWTDISPEVVCFNNRKHPYMWGLIPREFGGFRLGRRLMSEDSEILVARSIQKSREVFERLKRAQHSFFKDFNDLVLGKKIAEGGQADIYEGTCSNYNSVDEKPSECVVKAFKRGLSLDSLHSQWPSKLCQKIRNSYKDTGTSEIIGCTLLEDGRCAFVLQRYWGDLRTLIDHNMLETGNRCPPFRESVAVRILWQIARGMDILHENNILHKDLKASNVLLHMYNNGFSPEHPDCYVADFECSVGVVGTGFWRAPEILRALKKGTLYDAVSQCTKMTDVYSFGMLCYEVLTGRIPFEDKSPRDYAVVLSGQRPELPVAYKHTRIGNMVRACWDADPQKRPSFKNICHAIESEVNYRRWYLTENEFPYFGWRGKKMDASMVRWGWYINQGSRELNYVPYRNGMYLRLHPGDFVSWDVWQF